MENPAALALDFIRNVKRTLRAFKIYAAGHPEAKRGVEDSAACLAKMVAGKPSVMIGAREGVVLLDNAPIRDASPTVKSFCEILSARNIAAFSVDPGFTREELGHFLRLLATNPAEILRQDSIRPELLEPLRAIHVLKFIAVRGDAPDLPPAAAAAPAAVPANLSVLLSSLLGPAPPSASPSLGTALAPLLNDPDLVARLFEKVVEQSLAGRPAGEFLDEYVKGVGSLPEPVRKSVAPEGADLIERLPLGLRSRVVADDLLRGATSPERLRAVVARLAPTAEDLVRLFETVSRRAAESSASPEEEKRRIAESLRLVPLSGELDRKRPTVLLVARDDAAAADRTRSLEAAGFRVSGAGQPDAALPEILRTGAFDLALVDLSRCHLSELQPLLRPGPGRALPPCLYLEDPVRVRDGEELKMYPESGVVYLPVETPELVAALRALLPDWKDDPPSPPPAEEVAQALELKPHLQPKELPVPTGFTLAAFSRPGDGGGGGGYEVLSLARNRFGLLILEVPGHGVSAPAALFIARAGFLRAARAAETSAEATARANDALAGALPRGVFVRAAYAILDAATGRIDVTCAGLPRPLRWNDGDRVFKLIQASGLPLGPGFPGTRAPVRLDLAPGDHVLFHTEGIAGALNKALQPFGQKQVAQAARIAGGGLAGPAIAEVVEAILGYAADRPLTQDLTFLELHREPST
jgi:hypothetical protein